jgi:hypothetical protein
VSEWGLRKTEIEGEIKSAVLGIFQSINLE